MKTARGMFVRLREAGHQGSNSVTVSLRSMTFIFLLQISIKPSFTWQNMNSFCCFFFVCFFRLKSRFDFENRWVF